MAFSLFRWAPPRGSEITSSIIPILKSSFALIGFGWYLLAIANINLDIKYLSILFLILIFFLNILGIKKVGKVQIVIIASSILFLIILLIIGFFSTEIYVSDININIYDDENNFIKTIAFVYLSYAGVTKIAAIGGRFLKTASNIIINQFFDRLAQEISPEHRKKNFWNLILKCLKVIK